MNLGILTNLHDPLLFYYINKIKIIKKLKLFIFFSYIDPIKVEKSKKIFKDRTLYYFDKELNLSYIKKNSNKIYFVKSHNDTQVIDIIKKNRIDYLFNSGTHDKIKLNIIKSSNGIINIHPGLLPQYRGCTCVEWSLFNNFPLGITAHFMSDKYDCGNIISKEFIKLNKNFKYRDIRIQVYKSSINFLAKVIKKIQLQEFYKIEQDEMLSNFYKVIDDQKINLIKKNLNSNKYIFRKENLFSKKYNSILIKNNFNFYDPKK
jgi:methionyl-tRNA formyltransferase